MAAVEIGIQLTQPTKVVVPRHHNELDIDDAAGLAAIGKTQAFNRKFNFWTALAITVCINATVGHNILCNLCCINDSIVGRHVLGSAQRAGIGRPRWVALWIRRCLYRHVMCGCCRCRARKVFHLALYLKFECMLKRATAYGHHPVLSTIGPLS